MGLLYNFTFKYATYEMNLSDFTNEQFSLLYIMFWYRKGEMNVDKNDHRLT